MDNEPIPNQLLILKTNISSHVKSDFIKKICWEASFCEFWSFNQVMEVWYPNYNKIMEQSSVQYESKCAFFTQENAFKNVDCSGLIVLTAVLNVSMILVSSLQPVSVVSSKGLFSLLYLMGSKCHFTWPMGPRRLVGPVWSLQTDIYGTSCQLVWQNWQLTIHLNLYFLTFLEILKMYFSEASFNFWLLLMTASVCLCVHVSICPFVNPEHVHMISCDPLKPGSSDLDQWCKALWLRPPLFWGDWPWPLGSNLT